MENPVAWDPEAWRREQEAAAERAGAIFETEVRSWFTTVREGFANKLQIQRAIRYASEHGKRNFDRLMVLGQDGAVTKELLAGLPASDVVCDLVAHLLTRASPPISYLHYS